MKPHTSVLLGSYFQEFVENKILEGRYKDASDVIRAGLRLLEEEENRIVVLRNEIRKGIDSGIDEDFDPKKTLEAWKNIMLKSS